MPLGLPLCCQSPSLHFLRPPWTGGETGISSQPVQGQKCPCHELNPTLFLWAEPGPGGEGTEARSPSAWLSDEWLFHHASAPNGKPRHRGPAALQAGHKHLSSLTAGTKKKITRGSISQAFLVGLAPCPYLRHARSRGIFAIAPEGRLLFPSHGSRKEATGISALIRRTPEHFSCNTTLACQSGKLASAAACDLAQGSAFPSGKWVGWINNNSHHRCATLCSTFHLSHRISCQPNGWCYDSIPI